MTTYVFTSDGLMNKETGQIEPFNRNAPVTLPRIMRGDEIEPTMSMADGKMYTSKAKMRASYLPSGNPQGQRYIEIGDDKNYSKRSTERPKPDEAKITEAVDRAYADLQNGKFNN